MKNYNNSSSGWQVSPSGRLPMPLWFTVILFPIIFIWTLPQTLAGLLIGLYHRTQGHRFYLYRFGPFLFIVMRVAAPKSSGISLGVVVFSSHCTILKHEFCHLLSGLWLTWLYLPVYGLEYLIVGHSRSPHERVTNWFEEKLNWRWQIISHSSSRNEAD